MKTYLNLTWFHIRRILRNPQSLLLIVLPVAMAMVMTLIFSSGKNPQMGAHAFVNHSKYFEQEIYRQLNKEEQGPILASSDDIQDKLVKRDLDVIYEIPQDFEQSGKIIAHSLSGEVENQYVQEAIFKLWQKKQVGNLYDRYQIEEKQEKVPAIKMSQQSNYISVTTIVSLFMIFYMMYINAAMFAGDLVELRNNFVLKRSIISKSSGRAILGSILSAYGLLFLILNAISLWIVFMLNQVSISAFVLVLGYLLVNIVFIIGYILFMIRIFKEKQVLTSVSMIVAIAFVVLPMVIKGTAFESLGMLSPIYWTLQGLDYMSFFPQGLVILLMGLALFTAGSFKIESMARVA